MRKFREQRMKTFGKRGNVKNIDLMKSLGGEKDMDRIFYLGRVVALIGIILLLKSNWQIDSANKLAHDFHTNFIISAVIFLLGAVFTGITIRTLFNKYRNHSNIEAYKNALEIPEELVELEYES